MSVNSLTSSKLLARSTSSAVQHEAGTLQLQSSQDLTQLIQMSIHIGKQDEVEVHTVVINLRTDH